MSGPESEPYRLTRPCPLCPFRTDIQPYLRPGRVQEIARGLVRGEFYCHETVDYDDSGELARTPTKAHCAGALILLEKLEAPSQMMRIAERIGLYDASKLDMRAPVYGSFEAMAQACETAYRQSLEPAPRRRSGPGRSKQRRRRQSIRRRRKKGS